MSKKEVVVILILSVVVTYGVAIVDDIRRGSLLGGEGGIPFRFATGSFLGGSTDNLMLVLDIAFWFVIIWVIWKSFQKITAQR